MALSLPEGLFQSLSRLQTLNLGNNQFNSAEKRHIRQSLGDAVLVTF